MCFLKYFIIYNKKKFKIFKIKMNKNKKKNKHRQDI